MDLPPPFPPVCIHRVCPIQEQTTPPQVLKRIPRYRQFSKERYLPWSQHQWYKAHLLCNEMGSKACPPCQIQVQHQQDYASGKLQEIDFFRKKLQTLSGITWERPIAHIIPQMPMATAFEDSCLEAAGGYRISLGYWWHLPFPEEVIQWTLMHKKDNKDGLLILINVLEFVTVIINYCASLHVFMMRSITNDPHPVLLNETNNASALSWTNHTCRKSKLGRLLAWFFCSLLINSPLGINSQWISTDDNKIADDISQIKKTSSNSLHSFDYSSLYQTYPELTHCSFFQIQPELILLIWDIVLTEKWPTHKEVQNLKRKLLGSIIALNGQG